MRKLLALSCAVWSLYSYAEPIRISVNHSGVAGNDGSTLNFSPTNNTLFNVSADGRYIVYDSSADNLVAGDSNGTLDVFVRDQQTGITSRVSVASDGTQANGGSFAPSISADGRYVAFESSASNLITDSLNLSNKAIFLHDRQTGETVSVSKLTRQEDNRTPIISADGQFVLFSNNQNKSIQLYDIETAETQSIPMQCGDASCQNMAISETGHFIASGREVAYFDRQTGISKQIAEADSTRISISANGRYTVFSAADTDKLPCNANQKVDTFIYDSVQEQITCISQLPNGISGNSDSFALGLVADDQRVAFVSKASNLIGDDSNGKADLFFYDIQTGLLTAYDAQVSINRSSISKDGNTIVYVADDLQVYSQTVSELPVFVASNTVTHVYESPSRQSQESGLGLIRGWHCTAKQIQFQIDNQNKQPLISGLSREDTRSVCGDANNGYSTLLNYNLVGAGEHTIRLYADNVLFAEERFSVVGFGQEFMKGLQKIVTVSDFPATGDSSQLSWSEAHQNFVVTESSASQAVVPKMLHAQPVNKSDTEIIRQATRLSDPFTGQAIEIEAIASSSTQSDDGRWHLFVTDVDGLVAEDENGLSDLFLYDEQLQQLSRIEVSNDKDIAFQGQALDLTVSGNEQWLAFSTGDLVWLYDIQNTRISNKLHQQVHFDRWASVGSQIEKVSLSVNGRYIAYYLRATRHEFRGDTRVAYANLFVYDTQNSVLAAVLPSTEVTITANEEARMDTRFGFSDDETVLRYRIKPALGQNPSSELKELSLDQVFLSVEDHRGSFESPGNASVESGLGLIRGWVCEAETVFMQIDNKPWVKLPYGVDRGDTQSVCDDSNNGYAYLINWNLLGAGQHRMQVFADGYRIGDETFTVTTLGQEFVTGVSRTVPIDNFPLTGDRTTLKWSEPHQNFVVTDYVPAAQ